MTHTKLAQILLKRLLVESFGVDPEKAARINGALEILSVEGAVSFGGWKPGAGDYYRVVSRRKVNVYMVFDRSCECADHFYHGTVLVCAHREAVRAFVKGQKLLPHYQAFEREGVSLSL